MRSKTWIACGFVVAATAGAALAATTVTATHGKFDEIPESRMGGRYKMQSLESEKRAAHQIKASARHLNVTPDLEGSVPTYNLFLVAGETATDFGAMRVNHHGNAAFK